MRKFIIALLLLGSILFLIGRLSEVETILITLQRGDWLYISLALGLMVLWLLNISLSYQSILRAFGIEEKISVLLPLSASMFFLGVIAPSAGMSSIALLIAEARKRGFSPARAAVAEVLAAAGSMMRAVVFLPLGLRATMIFWRPSWRRRPLAARYCRPGLLHGTFNFKFTKSRWNAAATWCGLRGSSDKRSGSGGAAGVSFMVAWRSGRCRESGIVPQCPRLQPETSRQARATAAGSVSTTKATPASAPARCASWLTRPRAWRAAYQL